VGIIVGQVLVVRMLCDVVLVRKEEPDAAKLENARTAEEDGTVAVSNDRVGVVFVQGLELALRLQNKAGRDFTIADGGSQIFKLGDLPNVGKFVEQALDMDGQAPAVHAVHLFA